MSEQLVRPISLGDIMLARGSSYLKNSEGADYSVERGSNAYLMGLPRFQGRTVRDVLEARLADGEGAVRVLDIGCGQGIFLAQLMHDYPQVVGYGISAHDFRDEKSPWSEYVDKVNYTVGNAHNIVDIYQGISFDLVVSRYCIEYLGDPLSVLKQAYRLTSEGGIIFFDKLGTQMSLEEAWLLKRVWKKQGIESELERWASNNQDYSRYSPAIKRSSGSRLPLPFKYTSVGDPNPSVYKLIKTKSRVKPSHLEYEFDSRLAMKMLWPSRVK